MPTREQHGCFFDGLSGEKTLTAPQCAIRVCNSTQQIAPAPLRIRVGNRSLISQIKLFTAGGVKTGSQPRVVRCPTPHQLPAGTTLMASDSVYVTSTWSPGFKVRMN